jgi:hypothetical protein
MHRLPRLSGKRNFTRLGKKLKGILFDSPFLTLTATAMTIGEWDDKSYEPLLAAIRETGWYNEFEGPRVEGWLRQRLFANKGPVAKVEYGQSYSPLLVLTVAHCDPNTKVQLNLAERRRQVRKLAAEAKTFIKPDKVTFVGSDTVRLWWD